MTGSRRGRTNVLEPKFAFKFTFSIDPFHFCVKPHKRPGLSLLIDEENKAGYAH